MASFEYLHEHRTPVSMKRGGRPRAEILERKYLSLTTLPLQSSNQTRTEHPCVLVGREIEKSKSRKARDHNTSRMGPYPLSP